MGHGRGQGGRRGWPFPLAAPRLCGLGLFVLFLPLAESCRSSDSAGPTVAGGKGGSTMEATGRNEPSSAPHLACPEGSSAVPAHDVAYRGEVCARPDGTLDGPLVAWFRDGAREREGQYREGKPVGRWTWWDPEGRVNQQGEYADGQQTGVWREWRLGRKTSEGRYEAGKREGEWTTWNVRTGKVESRGRYVDGLASGTWMRWYADGAKAETSFLEAGRYEGAMTQWHPNGQKALEATYHDDKQVGTWTWWREDGSIEKQEEFGNGEERQTSDTRP